VTSDEEVAERESGGAARPGGRARLGRNVVALALVSLLTDVSSEMIYPLLPVFLGTVIGASPAFIGVIEGAAESTASLLKLASGWWSDRVRRRKPLVVAGYALATLARPLVGIATSATQVLVIRLTDRVGKGIRTSPRDALIADSVPIALRGRAYGFHRGADHFGAVLGPLVAFALLQLGGVSLRELFLWSAVPGALAVLVLLVRVREVAPEGAESGAGAGPPPDYTMRPTRRAYRTRTPPLGPRRRGSRRATPPTPCPSRRGIAASPPISPRSCSSRSATPRTPSCSCAPRSSACRRRSCRSSGPCCTS
jgi:MFS family permease